jgi:hypothetical protein
LGKGKGWICEEGRREQVREEEKGPKGEEKQEKETLWGRKETNIIKNEAKRAQMDGFDSFWGLYCLIEGLEWLSEGVSHRKIIAKSTKILENHQFWTISKRFKGVLRVQISHQTAKRKEKGTYSGFERPICLFIEGLGVFSMGFRGILPGQTLQFRLKSYQIDPKSINFLYFPSSGPLETL